MATVTTVAAVKAALVDELEGLAIGSATAAAPTEVQVAYARPAPEQLRSEAIYWSDEMRTVLDNDQRMVSGRRKRYGTWGLELVVTSAILSDAETAEARCFAMVAAVEDFLAANPKPSAWATTPTDAGALWLVVTGYSVEQAEHNEGFLAVEATVQLELKERLQ